MLSFNQFSEKYLFEASEKDFSHIPDFDPTNPEHKELVQAFNRGHAVNDPEIPRQKTQIPKQIKSLSDLRSKVDKHLQKIKEVKAEKEKSKSDVEAGADVIKENPSTGLKAYHVKNREASVALGQKGWCVADPDPMRNLFHHYNTGRSVMIHMPNEEEPYKKVAFFPGKQAGVSQKNETISPEDFQKLLERNPEIKDIPQIWGSRGELKMPEHLKESYARNLSEKLKKGTYTGGDISHARDNGYLNEEHKRLLPDALSKKLESGDYNHLDLKDARDHSYFDHHHKDLLPEALHKKIAKGDYTSDDIQDAVGNYGSGYINQSHKDALSDDFTRKLKENSHNFDDILSAERGGYFNAGHGALLARRLAGRVRDGKHDVAELVHARQRGYLTDDVKNALGEGLSKKLKNKDYTEADVRDAWENQYLNDDHKKVLSNRLSNKINAGTANDKDRQAAMKYGYWNEEHAKKFHERDVKELHDKIANDKVGENDLHYADKRGYLTQGHKDALANKLSEKIDKTDDPRRINNDLFTANQYNYLTDHHIKQLSNKLNDKIDQSKDEYSSPDSDIHRIVQNGMHHGYLDNSHRDKLAALLSDHLKDKKDISNNTMQLAGMARYHGYLNDDHRVQLAKILHKQIDKGSHAYNADTLRHADAGGYLTNAHQEKVLNHLKSDLTDSMDKSAHGAVDDTHLIASTNKASTLSEENKDKLLEHLSEHAKNKFKEIHDNPNDPHAMTNAKNLFHKHAYIDSTISSDGYNTIEAPPETKKIMADLLSKHLKNLPLNTTPQEEHDKVHSLIQHARDHGYLNNDHREQDLYRKVVKGNHTAMQIEDAKRKRYLSPRIKSALAKGLDKTEDQYDVAESGLYKHAIENGYATKNHIKNAVYHYPQLIHHLNSLQLHNLSRSDFSHIRERVANNANTAPITLHSMRYDPDENVRTAVASNPNTRSDTLHRMRHQIGRDTLQAIINNPNTHDKTLEHLASRSDVGIDRGTISDARKKLDQRKQSKKEDENFRQNIPNIDTETLQSIRKIDHPIVKKHYDAIDAELQKRGEKVGEKKWKDPSYRFRRFNDMPASPLRSAVKSIRRKALPQGQRNSRDPDFDFD